MPYPSYISQLLKQESQMHKNFKYIINFEIQFIIICILESIFFSGPIYTLPVKKILVKEIIMKEVKEIIMRCHRKKLF